MATTWTEILETYTFTLLLLYFFLKIHPKLDFNIINEIVVLSSVKLKGNRITKMHNFVNGKPPSPSKA